MGTDILDDYANNIHLAWNRKLPFTSLLEYATLLEQRGLHSLAIALYQTWLQKNKTPHDHYANFNLGVCLFNEMNFKAPWMLTREPPASRRNSSTPASIAAWSTSAWGSLTLPSNIGSGSYKTPPLTSQIKRR